MARKGENVNFYLYFKQIEGMDKKIKNNKDKYVSRSKYIQHLVDKDLGETKEDKILEKFNNK